MSKVDFGWFCLLFLVFLPVLDARSIDAKSGANGGVDCAVCSVVLGLVDKLTIVHNESVEHTLERLCEFLPGDYKVFCKLAVQFLGPTIIDGFIRKDNPDVICHTLKLCEDTPGQPKCRIYPPDEETISMSQRAQNLRIRHPELTYDLSKGKICQFPGIKEICNIIDNIFDRHLPEIDHDHDKFGTEETLRGASWRGKDCDDKETLIHPGARTVQGDAAKDHDCNGISGIDNSTEIPWETQYCNESNRLGIAVLGDSISAHFHIPEQWLDAREFSMTVFEHLPFILENELDWPQMSATTGHVNVTWPNIEGL